MHPQHSSHWQVFVVICRWVICFSRHITTDALNLARHSSGDCHHVTIVLQQ